MNRLRTVLFACLAIASGIVLAAMTPIGQVADETAHIIRADAITHGKFLGRRLPSQWYGPSVMQAFTFADHNLFWVAVDSLIKGHRPQTADSVQRLRSMPWQGTLELFEIGNLAGYMPVFYLPAAAGLGAARLLGASPYDAIEIGRLVNVLVFAVLGAAALLVARRGRAVMLCVLSVPMSLSLGASFNQDGLLIAAAVLAASLASRAWEHVDTPEEIVRTRWFWGSALLIMLIGTVKPPYLPIGVMLLMPLPASWSSRTDREALWVRLGVVALVCLPAVLWVVFALPTATGSSFREPYPAGPLWPGPPTIFRETSVSAQLQTLLAHPWHVIVELPVRTFLADLRNLWRQGVGMLGWLDLLLPAWLYTVWAGVIAASVASDMAAPRTNAPLRRRRRLVGAEALLLVAAVLVTVWAIYLSQYLSWTNIGKDGLDGPSGRYLLPLVPLLALALPRVGPWGGQLPGRLLGWAPLVPLVIGLYVLPRMLLGAYYLH